MYDLLAPPLTQGVQVAWTTLKLNSSAVSLVMVIFLSPLMTDPQ